MTWEELVEHIRKDRATFSDMEIAASMLHRLEWAEACRVAKEACDNILAKADPGYVIPDAGGGA